VIALLGVLLALLGSLVIVVCLVVMVICVVLGLVASACRSAGEQTTEDAIDE
jgi:hypothetical protein